MNSGSETEVMFVMIQKRFQGHLQFDLTKSNVNVQVFTSVAHDNENVTAFKVKSSKMLNTYPGNW